MAIDHPYLLINKILDFMNNFLFYVNPVRLKTHFLSNNQQYCVGKYIKFKQGCPPLPPPPPTAREVYTVLLNKDD